MCCLRLISKLFLARFAAADLLLAYAGSAYISSACKVALSNIFKHDRFDLDKSTLSNPTKERKEAITVLKSSNSSTEPLVFTPLAVLDMLSLSTTIACFLYFVGLVVSALSSLSRSKLSCLKMLLRATSQVELMSALLACMRSRSAVTNVARKSLLIRTSILGLCTCYELLSIAVVLPQHHMHG